MTVSSSKPEVLRKTSENNINYLAEQDDTYALRPMFMSEKSVRNEKKSLTERVSKQSQTELCKEDCLRAGTESDDQN